MLPKEPILLFDGVCNLCNRSVQRVLENEKKPYYKFASLQSDAGQQILKELGKDSAKFESLILIENGKAYEKTRAVFKILPKLKLPYPLILFFWPVPYFIRDWVYDWVAKNRYKWYGKRNECWLPTPDLKERFID